MWYRALKNNIARVVEKPFAEHVVDVTGVGLEVEDFLVTQQLRILFAGRLVKFEFQRFVVVRLLGHAVKYFRLIRNFEGRRQEGENRGSDQGLFRIVIEFRSHERIPRIAACRLQPVCEY